MNTPQFLKLIESEQVGPSAEFPIAIVGIFTNGKDLDVQWNEEILKLALDNPQTMKTCVGLRDLLFDSLTRALESLKE